MTAPWSEAMDQRDPSRGLYFEGFRLERFGLYRLDRAGAAEPVALGSRALDLLWLLAERHGEVVAKDAIMRAVWAGTTVEEGNLTVQIAGLRRVLDRDRAQGSCIQTIPGRGYRFVAPVELLGLRETAPLAVIGEPEPPAIDAWAPAMPAS